MKKNIHLIILAIIISLAKQPSVWGDSFRVNGIAFSLNNVHVDASSGTKSPFLALDLSIYNSTETRKLDLPKSVKFALADEFGNNYSNMQLAGNQSTESCLMQSIYPHQTCVMHLAFELPVAKAKNAQLQFEGHSFGLTNSIRIPLALPNNDNLLLVKITSPENGTVVERGILVHLNVTVIGPKLPDGIIIDAFNYTYEDKSPAPNNVYDLNVPGDASIGPQSVNVIAKWKNNVDSGNATSSDNIILNVKDSSPLNIF